MEADEKIEKWLTTVENCQKQMTRVSKAIQKMTPQDGVMTDDTALTNNISNDRHGGSRLTELAAAADVSPMSVSAARCLVVQSDWRL